MLCKNKKEISETTIKIDKIAEKIYAKTVIIPEKKL